MLSSVPVQGVALRQVMSPTGKPLGAAETVRLTNERLEKYESVVLGLSGR